MWSFLVQCSLLLSLFSSSPRALALQTDEESPHLEGNKISQTKVEEMLRHMNLTADPCEDFYEFTCGNFNTNNDSSLDEDSFFLRLNKLSVDKIQNILNSEDPAMLSTTVADKQISYFYRSCLRLRVLEIPIYRQQVLNVLKEYGSWPLLKGDQWQEENFDLLAAAGKIIQNTHLNILFDIDIIGDFHNNSLHRVSLGEALQNRDLYVNELFSSYRKMTRDHMAQRLQTFLDLDYSAAIETAEEIFNFTVGLAHGLIDEKWGLLDDEIYTLAPLEQVQQMFLPLGDFGKFLNATLGFLPEQVYLNKTYVENVLDLLTKTPKKVVANYMFYTLMDKFMVDTSDLDTFCLQTIQEYFYRNLDNMIYRQFYNSRMKEGILSMWQQIKATFQHILLSPRLNWLQKDTRHYALDKLQHMKLAINTYEEYDFETEALELDLNSYDYVGNIAAILQRQANTTRSKINQPPQPEEAGDVGSYSPIYIAETNEVKLPVSFLEPDYVWSHHYPQAYNFATLGFIIAHEIIHSFDDGGRYYDIQGNLRDWWDSESGRELMERTQCFRDQYKTYNYRGRPLPETFNQGENIADNSGIRLAFEAYRQWYQKRLPAESNGHFPSMPGLNYTHQQLFFISFGQVMCSEIISDDAAHYAATDIHAPDELRIFGSLSNFDEFSKVFQCSPGSKMNPARKCEIY